MTDPDPKRLAYADPPYVGLAHYYDHPESSLWNEPEAHVDLMRRLDDEYDGWALSLHTPALRALLPEAPERVRVAAWVKPFAAFKANVRIAYAWEPVIFAPARLGSSSGAAVGRDYLSAPITQQRSMIGAKPAAFMRWVLDLLGYVEGDEVDDLFPGSAIMARVLTQTQLVLETEG